MTSSAPPAVEASRLSKRFGRVQAVSDVSLAVEQGAYATLLGPSGSGKTSLLRLIAGLEIPDRGEITINGLLATHLPPYRRNLGVVFQGYALFPHLSALDNVAYPLRMRRTSRAASRSRAAVTLGRLGLAGLEGRRPIQLSGGQQQRVALARALVHDPPLLLLDEPLSALDRGLRESMRIELRRIQREFNVAVLHVTHDQEEALSLSDTVVLLESGHIVQQGPPEEMYERPATPFVARFLGGSALRGAVCGHQPAGADAFCVQVASRHFRARAPEGTRALQSGSLVIQREWLRLGDGDGAEGHEGIVTSIAYLGGIYELGVRLADGVDVSLRLPSGRCASAAREGAAVTVAQTHDAWFIPDEAATELTRG